MAEEATDATPVTWNRGAITLAEEAERLRASSGHTTLSVNHWLVAVLERHGPMAEGMVWGLDAVGSVRSLRASLRAGVPGNPLSVATVRQESGKRARARGIVVATERDVARVVVEAAGYTVTEQAPAATTPAGPVVARDGGAWKPVATRPTPTIEQFGRDLTAEAAADKLPPVVGREAEIDLVIETLCRRTKRNPVLVGPAGVGKTAIVEGLAQRVVKGQVPQPLRGVRVMALQPSTLVAGAKHMGELEQRVKAVLAEASQVGILLFIDEVHSIIGAGGAPGTGDIASQIKPVMARGDLALVAATTDDEYRQFIEPDSALERRFQPVRVHELSADETVQVLFAVRDVFARRRGIEVGDDVLRWIVGFAQNFMRNRRFPDKAVDLLDQCVAHAMSNGKQEVDRAIAEKVASRLIGRPMPGGAGDLPVQERILSAVPFHAEDVEGISNRIAVTTRSLDIRPHRPNAVVLLAGEAVAHAMPLAQALAEGISGSPDRVVQLDCSQYVHREDVTRLLGAPPGYVGFGETLPLHGLVQMPWSVLLLQGIDGAHPQIRDLVAEALSNGYFTDGHGRRIWLSDSVVVLTASVAGGGEAQPLGFGRSSDAPASAEAKDLLADAIGPALLRQVDVVIARIARSDEARRRWIEGHLLPNLARRWLDEGVRIEWDDSLVHWILDRPEGGGDGRGWERLIEDQLGPAILARLRQARPAEMTALKLSWYGGALRVEPSSGP